MVIRRNFGWYYERFFFVSRTIFVGSLQTRLTNKFFGRDSLAAVAGCGPWPQAHSSSSCGPWYSDVAEGALTLPEDRPGISDDIVFDLAHNIRTHTLPQDWLF